MRLQDPVSPQGKAAPPKRAEARLEVKFKAGEEGVFEGYASVFDNIDEAGDRIARGAFRETLEDFRAENRQPPLLWQHDAKEPIGAFREIYEDARGLFVKGVLFTQEIERAREAWKLMREGVVTGLSIGYRARQSFRDEKSGVRVLTRIDLLEISMVTFPANTQARAVALKSALAAGRIPKEKEFEAFLRDAGFSRKQAKGLLSRGYDALCPREAGENDANPREAGENDANPREAGWDIDDTDAAAVSALAAKIRSLTP